MLCMDTYSMLTVATSSDLQSSIFWTLVEEFGILTDVPFVSQSYCAQVFCMSSRNRQNLAQRSGTKFVW